MKAIYLGTSIAISWAWGTSLILGMQIAQTKGIEAFSIWALANCFTLFLFGALYQRKILKPEVLNQKIVRVFVNLIQIFCLIIQLKILNETFQSFFSPTTSYLTTALMGIALTLLMYKKGLAASIFTDLWQGILTLVILGSMVLYGFSNSVSSIPLPSSDSNSILWAIWSACILLSGIMTDLQHWQRASVTKEPIKAFSCAMGFFFFYLSLVLVLSLFKLDSLMNLLLLVAVIGVTTSTIDSIAVALHKDFGRKYGTLLCLLICVGFGLLVELSVLSLWSYFGSIRVGLAIYILYWCFTQNASKQRTINSSI